MPQVGRPRTTTGIGSRAPTQELGVPDFGLGGNVMGFQGPLISGSGPWRMYVDEWEYVPELRWPFNVQLYSQMRTDSQLAGLLTAVMWGISQLRYVVDPNGCPDGMVKEISEDLNVPILGKDDQPRGRMKGRFSNSKHVTQAMLAAIWGHMYFNIKGDIVDGKWRLRKLAPRLPQTIRQINVADDGGLVSIQQWASANRLNNAAMPLGGPEIPVDNLVAFIFMQEGVSWTGRSFLRDCYKDWLIKDRDLRIESINHERAGGVPYANAPMGATVDEVSDLDQMMRHFRIGETAGGALPYGAELHIAKGTGSDIDRTIKRLDESMARRFLLQLANLAQGGQHVGSYALSETFEDFFLVGQRQIAQWYCDTMTEHLIEDTVDWNYGEDTELTPRLTWERSSEDSLGTEALSNLVNRGVITMDQELENVIRYRYLLPKKTEPRPEVSPGGPRQPFEQKAQTQGPQSGTVPGKTPVETAPSTAAGLADLALPSSGSAVHASFWRRLTGRAPDVQASKDPAIMTVPNVPILEAGVEYQLSTGPTTFTPEDLRDVVTAANEDRSIPNPRLGIGHIDPRYNDPKLFDGTPNFGIASNLRLSENGMIVYADYLGVPRWLGNIMPYAFPSRSVEGYWAVESQMGKKYSFVLSRCCILGVQWPGVTVLEDLPMYYGEEVPADVVVDPALLAVAASQPGGDPMKFPWSRETAASANLDDVRRAFYSDYVPEHRDEGALMWWVRAVLTDPNELVVEDDETGQLYLLPFTSDSRGTVGFGDSQAVKIDYVPDDRESLKAAAVHVAATLAVGRNVLASWPSRAASRPDNTGGSMDPKEVRKQLSLPEDASDEQVHQALLQKAGITQPAAETPPADPPAPQDPPAPGEPPAPQDPPAPTEEGNVVQLPVAAAADLKLPPGTVLVDENAWKQTQDGLGRALSFAERQEKHDREALVAAAIGDGRIPPASKDHWLNLLKTDPNGSQALASLAKGLVPVEERGHSHSPDQPGTVEMEQATVAEWSANLFPEVRRQRQHDAAAASGQPVQRSRVSSDGNYGRR